MEHPHFKLIGHRLCPYVQRVAMVMGHYAIDHEREDIRLEDKPAWPEKFSSERQVPVLLLDKTRPLTEAAVICDYLDRINGRALYPVDLIESAEHSIWILRAGRILSLTADLVYRAHNEHDCDLTLHRIGLILAILNKKFEAAGPFREVGLCMVDMAYATAFRAFPVLVYGLNRDLFAGFEHVRGWSERLLKNDIVRTVVPQTYHGELHHFIASRQSYLAKRLSMLPVPQKPALSASQ